MHIFSRTSLHCSFLGLFAVLFLVMVCPAAAESPSPDYELLRAQYLKLRNTDTEVSKVSEWKTVGEGLVRFADAHPASTSSPKALIDASIVHERLFQALNDDSYLQMSLAELRAVVERFPNGNLADDALLRIGDLHASRRSDVEAAKLAYLEAVRRYPRGDATEIARARLEQLEGGVAEASKRPNSEFAVKDAPLIVVDPGHGGEDFGAEGISGLYEKDIVLDIAFELERLLQETGRVNVKLTRRSDTFVPLADRTAFANDSDATLFLSIHSNASPKQKLSGLQTYYLDTAGDEASKLLAQRENAQNSDGASDLDFILSDLVQSAKLDDSKKLAATVHQALFRTLVASRWKVQSLGVRKAPFYVLVGAHMPCILVEVMFVDNPLDAKQLSNKAFRQAVAQGLFHGVSEFLTAYKAHHD